jgi:serine phosphatase RsbU (regulator of sigma subunit)
VTLQMQAFGERYSEGVRRFVRDRDEASLSEAYELGRAAFVSGLSVLDLAAAHRDAVSAIMRDADPAEVEDLVRCGGEFQIEALSTYEMAGRGFREAQETAELERRHAESLADLAAATVAINAARDPSALLEVARERGRALLGAQRAAAWTLDADVEPPTLAPELAAQAIEREVPTRVPAGDGVPGGWLAVPLLARAGRRLGLLEFGDAAGGSFDDRDEAIATQLGLSVAVALENARLYEREHGIAQTLQRSLLPDHLPDVEGLELAARYRPAGDGQEVGGDFYDIFQAVDGRWIVVLGDVCGKGPEAAAVTALARYTLRTAAMADADPDRLLGVLNRSLLHHGDGRRFCTVVCAAIDVAVDPVAIDVAAGGHPLPLVVTPGQEVRELGTAGTLLGVVDDPEISVERALLEPGSSVLLYTDGLTDAAAPNATWTAADVADAVRRLRGLETSRLVEALELEALHGRPRSRDDMAILALRLREGARAAAI